jgi:anti-sigma regulatory factor (Ser/Thr protein kinase)
VELRPEPTAPATARHFIAATCEASGVDPDICATAALLVSELVTNAVLHAGTEVVMHVIPAAERLRVEVVDGHPGGHVRAQTPDPSNPRGRGLHMVDLLADDWGVTENEGGKTVWFELATKPSRR